MNHGGVSVSYEPVKRNSIYVTGERTFELVHFTEELRRQRMNKFRLILI